MIWFLLLAVALADPPPAHSATAVLTVTAYVVGPCDSQTVPGAVETCGAPEGRRVDVPPAEELVEAGYVPNADGVVEVNP